MTREEAIKILKEIDIPVNGDNKKERNAALYMAIKALEQGTTTKNDSKFCPDRKAKTTNMETILHCIENECAAYKDGKCLKYNSDQEPTTKNDNQILEDIKGEILEQYWGDSRKEYFSDNDSKEYKEGAIEAADYIIKIIDKYKAESEDT